MLSFTSRVAVPPHVLVRCLEKESVLLNLETERYFGLDESGTHMWQILTASSCIGAAYQQLLGEYEVEADLLSNHLAELLGRLEANGLLHVLPGDAGTNPAV